MKRYLVPLAGLASILFAATAAAEFVRVMKDGVNIRTAPKLDSTIVVAARLGDVFQLNGTVGEWYEVSMFAGEYRYIHISLAERITKVSSLPASSDVRRSACLALVRAQDRAVAEAEKRYPTDVLRRIDLERLLYDRYELPVFREYDIPPARSATLLVECAKKNWIPR